jgi:hypothetical protein
VARAEGRNLPFIGGSTTLGAGSQGRPPSPGGAAGKRVHRTGSMSVPGSTNNIHSTATRGSMSFTDGSNNLLLQNNHQIDTSVNEVDEDDMSMFTCARETAGPDAVAATTSLAAAADTASSNSSKRRSIIVQSQQQQTSSGSTTAATSGPVSTSGMAAAAVPSSTSSSSSNATAIPSNSSSSSTIPSSINPSSPPPPAVLFNISPTDALHLLKHREHRSRQAASLFGWPASEQVIKDFSCGMERSIMLHGRLFISENFIAFESSLFSGTKVCIPISEILSACEANQALIFPNAIKVFCRPSQKEGGVGAAGQGGGGGATSVDSSYFFGSFAPGGRTAALELITSLVNQTYDPTLYHMHITMDQVKALLPHDKSNNNKDELNNKQQSTTSSSTATTRSMSASDDEDESRDTVNVNAEDASTVDDGLGSNSNNSNNTSVDVGMEFDADGFPITGPRHRGATSLDFGPARNDLTSAGATSSDSETQQMLEICFPTINSRTFFRLFLSDAALYTAHMFHTSRGDTEYQASGWKDAKLIPGALAQGWNQCRDTMVRVPVVGSPMGPDSTRVLKVQKMKWEGENNNSMLLETVAVTPDVPFGDCFLLIDQWNVTDQPNTGGCKLKIQLTLKFIKSNWKLRPIKSMLVSRAFGDNKKGFEAHIQQIQKWMENHSTQVEAVKKAVGAAAAAATLPTGTTTTTTTTTVAASVPPVSPAPTPSTTTAQPSKGKLTSKSALPDAAAAAASSKPSAPAAVGGPLASLPSPLNNPMVFGGIIIGFLLFLFTLYFSFSDNSYQSGINDPAAALIAALTSSSSTDGNVTATSSPLVLTPAVQQLLINATASNGTPRWLIGIITLLLAAFGVLAFRFHQMEGELRSLRTEMKSIKSTLTTNSASSALTPLGNRASVSVSKGSRDKLKALLGETPTTGL